MANTIGPLAAGSSHSKWNNKMSRSFSRPSAFAEFLVGLSARIESAEHEGLKKAVDFLCEETKALIGHDQAEWKPLSEATIGGFHHPLAGYIEGKVEQGYGANEPLLRKGGLRDSFRSVVDGNTGTVGSDSMVAVWQEMGTPNAFYPIPPRPILGTAFVQKGKAAVEKIADALGHSIQG